MLLDKYKLTSSLCKHMNISPGNPQASLHFELLSSSKEIIRTYNLLGLSTTQTSPLQPTRVQTPWPSDHGQFISCP